VVEKKERNKDEEDEEEEEEKFKSTFQENNFGLVVAVQTECVLYITFS
jgi:hypothetical protein